MFLNVNILFVVAIFFLSLILGFFVLFKNIKNIKNWIYFSFSVSLSLWLLFSVSADFVKIEWLALFCAQIAMIFPPLITSNVLHFSLIFPKKEDHLSALKLFIVYLPVFVIEPFIFTSYNIKNYKLKDWGFDYTPGYLFLILIIFMIVYVSISIYILIKKYLGSKGLYKMQIKYFIYAISLGAIIGIFSNGIFPFLGYSQISIIGPALAVLIINISIGYAIVKYRLLDIRVIIQEALIYLTTSIYIILLYFAQLYILKNLTTINIEYLTLFAGITSMLLTVGSLKYINNIIKNLTSPLLFKNRYNFSNVWTDLNSALNSNLNLEKALNKSFLILMKALDIEKITFLLYDEALGRFVSKKSLGFSSEIKLEINKNNALYKYLNKIKAPVISDELEMKLNDGLVDDSEKNIAQKAIKQFKKWEVYICQPIIKNKSIIGIVCVGEKLSGNQFREEDLRLIDAFANQAVLVIENFLVFSEVTAKKNQLEKNMNLMVGRELKMIELKKKIKELEAKKKAVA